MWRTVPDPVVRTRFTLLLLAEGALTLTSGAGPLRWLGFAQPQAVGYTVHQVNDWLVLAIYLPAIASVIPLPLLRPFRSGRSMRAWVAVMLAGGVVTLVRPDLFVLPVAEITVPGWGAPYYPSVGPGMQVTSVLLALSYAVGFVATVLAWRDASTPLARRRAGVLSWAFGVRDLTFSVMFLLIASNALPLETLLPTIGIGIWSVPVYVGLVGYGVASVHLFDIDLRLKWTVERGTLAAVFVSVYFVVSEGAAAVLSDRLGTMVGLLATGALLLLLAPLQRGIERVSSRAMSNVVDTPEYRDYRRYQVYLEAYADALRAGPLDAVRQVSLARLRKSLGLSDEEVAGLESEYRAASAMA